MSSTPASTRPIARTSAASALTLDKGRPYSRRAAGRGGLMAHPHGRGRTGAADRVRQRRQSDAGPRGGPAARNRHPPRRRRRPQPPHRATAHRERDPGRPRRRRRLRPGIRRRARPLPLPTPASDPVRPRFHARSPRSRLYCRRHGRRRSAVRDRAGHHGVAHRPRLRAEGRPRGSGSSTASASATCWSASR